MFHIDFTAQTTWGADVDGTTLSFRAFVPDGDCMAPHDELSGDVLQSGCWAGTSHSVSRRGATSRSEYGYLNGDAAYADATVVVGLVAERLAAGWGPDVQMQVTLADGPTTTTTLRAEAVAAYSIGVWSEEGGASRLIVRL